MLLRLLLLAPALLLPGAAKPDKQPVAVVAGTVYRPPGFALPGAEVVVAPEGEPPSSFKFKKIRMITSARGEFAVRVPAVPMRYSVDVQCDGYKAQRKSVAIEGEQRQDLSFVLEPASPGQEQK